MGDIPQKYKELVGKEAIMSGGLFASNRTEPETKYNVLNIRWGTATILDAKQLKETGQSSYEHPTVEYLVKNDTMKKSRWTKGFPVREINLKALKKL